MAMSYPRKYLAANAPPTVLHLVDRILPLLIEGEHPALAALREQYRHASIKQVEFTGVGLLVDFEVPGDTALVSPRDFAGGFASITLAGARLGAGCVLFVRDGRLSTLEGFTYDDEWPEGTNVVSIDNVVQIQPNTTLYDHSTHGRIAEISCTEYPKGGGGKWGHKLIDETMRRHKPTFLVINLIGFVGPIDASLLSFVAAGAKATFKMGAGGKTRIVATGQTAAKVDEVLQLTKLTGVLGGGVYPDLESALEKPGPEDEAPG